MTYAEPLFHPEGYPEDEGPSLPELYALRRVFDHKIRPPEDAVDIIADITPSVLSRLIAEASASTATIDKPALAMLSQVIEDSRQRLGHPPLWQRAGAAALGVLTAGALLTTATEGGPYIIEGLVSTGRNAAAAPSTMAGAFNVYAIEGQAAPATNTPPRTAEVGTTPVLTNPQPSNPQPTLRERLITDLNPLGSDLDGPIYVLSAAGAITLLADNRKKNEQRAHRRAQKEAQT